VLGRTGRNAKPDPDGRMHESLKGAWHLAEFVPKRHYDWQKKKERRRMNLYRRRTIPDGALIHRSVFLREGGRYAKRLKLPPNYVIED